MPREYNEESDWEELHEEPLDDYRPLDFDDDSLYDGRLTPTLEEQLSEALDAIFDPPEEESESIELLGVEGVSAADPDSPLLRTSALDVLDEIIREIESDTKQED